MKARDLESQLADARNRLADLNPIEFKKHLEKFRSGAKSKTFEARVSGGTKANAPSADQIDRAIESSWNRYHVSAKEIIAAARLLEIEERKWTEVVEPFDESPEAFVCRSCGETVTNVGNDRLRKGDCATCYHRKRRENSKS